MLFGRSKLYVSLCFVYVFHWDGKELPMLIVYYIALGYQAEISFDVMFDKEKATSSYYVQSCSDCRWGCCMRPCLAGGSTVTWY